MSKTYLSHEAKARQASGFCLRNPRTTRSRKLAFVESELLGVHTRWKSLPTAWDDEYVKAFRYTEHMRKLAKLGLVSYRHWEVRSCYNSYYQCVNYWKRPVAYRMETYCQVSGSDWKHIACSIEQGPHTYELRFDTPEPPRGYAFVAGLTLDNSFLCE
jgi:hypothetical protein